MWCGEVRSSTEFAGSVDGYNGAAGCAFDPSRGVVAENVVAVVFPLLRTVFASTCRVFCLFVSRCVEPALFSTGFHCLTSLPFSYPLILSFSLSHSISTVSDRQCHFCDSRGFHSNLRDSSFATLQEGVTVLSSSGQKQSFSYQRYLVRCCVTLCAYRTKV